MIDPEKKSTLHIRPGVAADEAALFDICLKTADIGNDASDLYSDPRLPGIVWAVPYLHFDPDLVFVVANDQRALGYVLGVADTDTYNAWLHDVWWPKVRIDLEGIAPKTIRDREVFSYIDENEESTDPVPNGHPAHMHIDLLPEAQSGGWGRKLVDQLKTALRQRGAPGLHLGVHPENKAAIGFYEHIGFTRLDGGDLILGQRLL